MPSIRTRVIEHGYHTGTFQLYGNHYNSTRWNGRDTCEDVKGNPGADNYLFIDHTTVEGGLINGSRFDKFDGEWATFNDVPIVLSKQDGGIDFVGTEGSAIARAFAVTNPARHDVSLPAFIAELKDFPKMIRFGGRILNAGRDILPTYLKAQAIWSRRAGGTPFGRGLTPQQMRKLILARLTPSQQDGLSQAQILASANLALQFGWAPMIRDLQKMMDFQAAVNSRKKEIDRLYSGSGLRRRLTIQDDSRDFVVNDVVVDSTAGFVTVNVTVHCNTKRWCTIVYKPSTPSQLPPTDQRLREQMLGLSPHGLFASAWEVLPWSWLVDWFTNVGDVVNLTNNEFDTTFRANTMSRKTVKHSSPPVTVVYPLSGSKTLSACIATWETKARAPGLSGQGPFTVKMPILGTNQLSILGSLALLRGR